MGHQSPPKWRGRSHRRRKGGGHRQLGPFLCWAVVFADIGTSVYYTPGILFGRFGTHAALFVAMTLVVFVLLTIKYSEVPVRYPEGGGVVTVATQAIHPFAGLLGGMFILVDYFLTAAISALSGLIYFSVVAPSLKPVVLSATLAALTVLATLNLIGIAASAEVTAVVASIAAASQLAVVLAVVAHFGPGQTLATIPRIFSGPRLTPVTVLTGYAGAFLAFSGLESVAQLAPAMREPRRRVTNLAMGAVVATVGLTSPLLTLWSTTLLNARRNDPNQFISLLAGFSAGQWLEMEVAVTASILLVFASNTAIIGTYHVFLALSRMRFLPQLIQQRNRLRGTPHWAIILAAGIPILIVLVTQGNVGLLGDLYAFGLLGAFSMTCVSLDIVRWHELHPDVAGEPQIRQAQTPAYSETRARQSTASHPSSRKKFALGVLTTVLVVLAWTINLFAKPLATLFGGGVTVAGLLIALATFVAQKRRGQFAVFPLLHRYGSSPQFLTRARKARPAAVLAILPKESEKAEALVQAAIDVAAGRPVIFLQRGIGSSPAQFPRLFAVADPYLDDDAAQEAFSQVERLARERNLDRRYIYLPIPAEPDALSQLVRALRPEELLVALEDEDILSRIEAIGPYRPSGGSAPVLHLVARPWPPHIWQ